MVRLIGKDGQAKVPLLIEVRKPGDCAVVFLLSYTLPLTMFHIGHHPPKLYDTPDIIALYTGHTQPPKQDTSIKHIGNYLSNYASYTGHICAPRYVTESKEITLTNILPKG